MRAIIYARVSTGEQDSGMQVREMLEFSERRGWEHDVLTDSISGAKEKRPGLDQLMALARKRKCDVVLVYKFDRFARSLRHLLNALEEFEALGVAFISLHDNIDTTTPAGRLMFQIVGAFAEFERSIIRQRVRSGVAHARSQGIKLGRPRVIADIEKIRTLRNEGLSLRGIGNRLGISHASVIRALNGGTKSSVSRA
jgi:DNA invertase Pin-like site-specific DNA recombinase